MSKIEKTMKKTLLISMVLTMLTGIIMAQTGQVEQKMQQNVIEDKGYLLMENGKVLLIMDETGMGIKMENNMTLKNGAIIKPDGSYQLKSGMQLQLQNGQVVDANGAAYKSERKFLKKTHRGKNEKAKLQNAYSSGHQQHDNGSSSHHH
jgi:hypothetical protein